MSTANVDFRLTASRRARQDDVLLVVEHAVDDQQDVELATIIETLFGDVYEGAMFISNVHNDAACTPTDPNEPYWTRCEAAHANGEKTNLPLTAYSKVDRNYYYLSGLRGVSLYRAFVNIHGREYGPGSDLFLMIMKHFGSVYEMGVEHAALINWEA